MEDSEGNARIKIIRNSGWGMISPKTVYSRKNFDNFDMGERMKLLGESGWYEVVGKRPYLVNDWKNYVSEPPLVLVKRVRKEKG
jgi:hypothetical protein